MTPADAAIDAREELARAMASAVGEAWWCFPDQESGAVRLMRDDYMARADAAIATFRRIGSRCPSCEALSSGTAAPTAWRCTNTAGCLMQVSP